MPVLLLGAIMFLPPQPELMPLEDSEQEKQSVLGRRDQSVCLFSAISAPNRALGWSCESWWCGRHGADSIKYMCMWAMG